tara:strand:+ start:24206 stop:24577 length:372 start_codon:yes stop_codon:yes gene_type:complete
MASIIRRKSDNTVVYYFTNLVDIENINLTSTQANITINNGAKKLTVGDINTSTHEVINDVTAVHTWYGNVMKYHDTDGWSIDTAILNNINAHRKRFRDQDGSSEPADLKVYLTQEDYDADQEE